MPRTRRPAPPIRRVATALVALAAIGLLLDSAHAAAKAPPARPCARSEHVVNGGHPLSWTTRMFGALKSTRTAPVPDFVLRVACEKVAGRPHGALPGNLDLHQARPVADPSSPSIKWLIVPGSRGVALVLPKSLVYATRCELAEHRQISGFTFFGPSPLTSRTELWGLVANDVTSVTATGGQGPGDQATEATVSPKHNVFHVIAPRGIAALVFSRGAKPPRTQSIFGAVPSPPEQCPTIPQDEGWPGATPPAGSR